MNIKRISLFALGASALAAVLRTVQFLAFFDSGTGFFRDNGLISIVALTAVFLVPLMAFLVAAFKKTLYGRVKFHRNIPVGLLTLLCAGLLAFGVKLLHSEFMGQSRDMAVTAMGISFRGPFMWISVAMIAFMLVSAIAWISGKALFQHAKFLCLISVAWALSLILYVFIHYSISVLTTENVFIIILACAAAMAFMAQARFFSDLNPQGKSLRLLVPASLTAAAMMCSYAVSGIIIRFADIHPKYEVSMSLEVIILSVGIYMFLVLFALDYLPLAVPSKPKAPEGKRYKVDIKREL